MSPATAPKATDRVRPVSPIEARRRALRLSQRTAGEAAGITRQGWSDIERGLVPTPAVQEAVAEVLGCLASDLWGDFS